MAREFKKIGDSTKDIETKVDEMVTEHIQKLLDSWKQGATPERIKELIERTKKFEAFLEELKKRTESKAEDKGSE